MNVSAERIGDKQPMGDGLESQPMGRLAPSHGQWGDVGEFSPPEELSSFMC